jgi:STE24 endopeptidase
MPLANTIVRFAERRADLWALRATRRPEAFISAMERLSADNLAERNPPAWVETLLHDHPSIGRRIARARAWERDEE